VVEVEVHTEIQQDQTVRLPEIQQYTPMTTAMPAVVVVVVVEVVVEILINREVVAVVVVVAVDHHRAHRLFELVVIEMTARVTVSVRKSVTYLDHVIKMCHIMTKTS
jgi:hypothetical protein